MHEKGVIRQYTFVYNYSYNWNLQWYVLYKHNIRNHNTPFNYCNTVTLINDVEARGYIPASRFRYWPAVYLGWVLPIRT